MNSFWCESQARLVRSRLNGSVSDPVDNTVRESMGPPVSVSLKNSVWEPLCVGTFLWHFVRDAVGDYMRPAIQFTAKPHVPYRLGAVEGST